MDGGYNWRSQTAWRCQKVRHLALGMNNFDIMSLYDGRQMAPAIKHERRVLEKTISRLAYSMNVNMGWELTRGLDRESLVIRFLQIHGWRDNVGFHTMRHVPGYLCNVVSDAADYGQEFWCEYDSFHDDASSLKYDWAISFINNSLEQPSPGDPAPSPDAR